MQHYEITNHYSAHVVFRCGTTGRRWNPNPVGICNFTTDYNYGVLPYYLPAWGLTSMCKPLAWMRQLAIGNAAPVASEEDTAELYAAIMHDVGMHVCVQRAGSRPETCMMHHPTTPHLLCTTKCCA